MVHLKFEQIYILCRGFHSRCRFEQIYILCRGFHSRCSLQAQLLFGFFVAGTLAPVALTGPDFDTGFEADLFFPVSWP